MRKFRMCAAAAGLCILMAAVPMTSYGFSLFRSNSETEAAEETAYEFKKGDTVISMGAEAAPVLTALGTAKDTFEQDSCAYQGKSIVYLYDGFEMSTSKVDGKECIESVYVTGNQVSTPEGIKIGPGIEDVKKAYGTDYEESSGVYRYTAGNTELSFYTTNNVVDAIEYLVIVAQ